MCRTNQIVITTIMNVISVARMVMTGVRGAMKRNVFSLAGAVMVAPGLRSLRRKIDHSEYGGAPLLGLNGTCIISHGASNPRAIMNAVRVAMEAVKHGLNGLISRELQEISQEIKSAS